MLVFPRASEQIHSPVRRRFADLSLVLWPMLLYLGLFAYYLHANLRTDGGKLVYALDDPYIHLALAQNLAHGHYGINPGEAASPSSSFLWPFLLVPFASTKWFLWAPLFLNLLLGVALAGWLGYQSSMWPGWPLSNADIRGEWGRRLLAGAALVFVANLIGLTFVGMEHTLQVLLATMAAYAITRVLADRDVPFWVQVLVALGPSVRYEAISLVLAVALALAGSGKWRRGVSLLVASVIPLLLFSTFLHRLGLPWLPTSVLVKGGVSSQGNALQHMVTLVLHSLKAALTQRDRLLLALLCISLVEVARRQRTRSRRFALSGAALAAALHLAIGQFNWLHRYEVYIVLFCTLILLWLLFEGERTLWPWYALGLLACAGPYVDGTRALTAATEDIYLQQYQMHRFSTVFYHGNIAVNDLGLVSFDRPKGQYVLDLVGLGSAEAARQQQKTAAWLQDVTRRHDIGLAMIYDEWFSEVPSTWTPLGSLCLIRPPVMLSHPCVAFYATEQGSLPQIRSAYTDWAKTLPAGAAAVSPTTAKVFRGVMTDSH